MMEIFRDSHFRILEALHHIDPNILSHKMRKVVFPEQFRRKKAERYFKSKEEMPAAEATDSEEEEDEENDEETLFKIDINIDGTSIFKNSAAPQAIPILARIYSVSRKGKEYVIPIRMAKPFVIGLYYGTESKPPTEELCRDLIRDLVRLQPENKKADEISKRYLSIIKF
jgi:hypothetical protein